MQHKVKNLVSKVLDIDSSRLNLETGPGSIAEWDSLASLTLVSEIENEFDINLELEDILSINSVKDIVDIVEKMVGEKSIKDIVSNKHSDSSNIDFSGLLTPNQVITGINSVERLSEFLTGPALIILGSKKYSKKIIKKIELMSNLENITFLHKEPGEPNEEKVTTLISNLASFPNSIVGIGGGSVIDTCKLVYIKLLYPKEELSKRMKPFSLPKPDKDIDLISIPTTHGSGAEASSAVVFDTPLFQKNVILSHQLISKTVIYDSNLLTELPKNIAIDTTLDAFTHSIEGYLSKLDNPKVYALIVESLSIIIKEIRNYSTFDSELSKERLLWASYLAGIVQNHCSTGLCHSISHQLSIFGIGHGRLNAIFLPDVLSFNYSKDRMALDKLSIDIGFNSGEDLIEWLFEIQDNYGIGNLAKNISDKTVIKDFSLLIEKIKGDVTYSTTPFEIGDTELESMLQASLTK